MYTSRPVIHHVRRVHRRSPIQVTGCGNVTRIALPRGAASDRLRKAVYSDPAFDLRQLPLGSVVHRSHNTVTYVGCEWMAYQMADEDSVSVAKTLKLATQTFGASEEDYTDVQGTELGTSYTMIPIITPAQLSYRYWLTEADLTAGSFVPSDIGNIGLFSSGSGFTIDSYAGDDKLIAINFQSASYSEEPEDIIVIWDFSSTVSAGMVGPAGTGHIWNRMVNPTDYDVPSWVAFGAGRDTLLDDALQSEVARNPLDSTPSVQVDAVSKWAQARYPGTIHEEDTADDMHISQGGAALSGAATDPVLFAQSGTTTNVPSVGGLTYNIDLRFTAG